VYYLLEDMKDEEIDFDGFLDLMTARVSETDSQRDIMRIFSLFDEDNVGHIGFNDLKRVCDELGEKMSDRELQEMIERADLDRDGVITAQEFTNIMTKQTL
jgi:Ca2+-binding EF-hand superfamily protein